ncbi:hypothetical protein GF402_03990 [Candidatus Fermentibacteria bacterium]|nr:hypothetical protein [Candidatus Fermentibacteria bacterium]
MKLTLRIRGIALEVVLGELPRERIFPRRVFLDLRWEGDCDPSSPEVDYEKVCVALSSLRGNSYRYAEELASEAMDVLRDGFPRGSWKVTIRKPFPPCNLPVDEASVTLNSEPID